jgi:hypothetical protein
MLQHAAPWFGGVQGYTRVACAEVSTGSVEASKARLGFSSHMASGICGRVVDVAYLDLDFAVFLFMIWCSNMCNSLI